MIRAFGAALMWTAMALTWAFMLIVFALMVVPPNIIELPKITITIDRRACEGD